MQVYTCPEALRKFAIILEQAENTGRVRIQREDGRTFALILEDMASSPLDVSSIHAKITSDEIVGMVREGRERELEK